ncbi:Sec-independent protein translocase protein TatB [uncultured Bosea sp.]|uniref:Sec-independent protein translocase protein TatB n=1 Tax=uncultured Bosea sp. TaxID=211457 RepID=UPI0025E3D206|nr:Sec-independent protein translocase protein TatB [uncultured Bosea sp.]
MFDIAWSEMVLIGAVALVVIGPKDLPKALRTVGQTVGRIRRMASEFQGQFNEAMREAELADLKKQVEDVGGSVSSALNNDFKPIDIPKEFDPAKPEASKPDEAALKEAEAKLASLPPPEPLPPVQIAAEVPKPAEKPKRARKAAAEPAPAVVEAPVAPVAVAEPTPAKPARKRGVKAVEAPVAVEAPAPVPVAAAPVKAAKAPAAARKPKAVVAAAPADAAKPAARKRKIAKGEENSA